MTGRRIDDLLLAAASATLLVAALNLPANAQDGEAAVEAESAAVSIPTPDDPVAKAAFAVLETHCSRCHQDGMLVNRLKPAKNFGNILMLDELAANSHYIVPGNPDGSKIVQMILNKEMPYDVNYEFDMSKPDVTEEDLTALRTWITALGETRTASCTDRTFIDPVAEVTAMATDIEQLPPTRVADTRYVSLTHLYNACASDEEMNIYRQGAVKLLNSLSRVSDVLRLETVGDAGTLVRFNLKDLGWDPEDWDKVLAVYPYGVRPDSQMFDLVASATLTPLPYVRGDWLAFTAAQPPLYDELLQLADDFDGLQHDLDVEVQTDIDRFVAKRAGFQESGVSQNNRLIERHTISTGYFWTSYDFAGNRERQSLFQFPLGPGDDDFAFHHDGGETIFSLPNGFQAYYLNKADGTRLDKGPTQIVRDLSRRDLTVTNGISCMGCHDQGIRKAKDDVRPHVTADRTFPRAVRDAVEALYPTHEEMDAILEADATRFRNAMLAAGLEPALKLNGVEMINALAKAYEEDVELALAAAEFGQNADDFTVSVDSAPVAEAQLIGRRLEQGLVPRDTFEAEYIRLAEAVSDLEPIDLSALAGQRIDVATVARPIADSRTFDLALFSDRSAYKVDDNPVFTVTPAEDCFLTLINVDGTGSATVIFPNQFQKDNALKAKSEFNFPSDDAPFQFRFADPGTETVIAICSLKDKPVDAIQPDYRTAFTDLGDYEAVLTRAIKVEARPTAGGSGTKDPGDIVARAAIKMPVE